MSRFFTKTHLNYVDEQKGHKHATHLQTSLFYEPPTKTL